MYPLMFKLLYYVSFIYHPVSFDNRVDHVFIGKGDAIYKKGRRYLESLVVAVTGPAPKTLLMAGNRTCILQS